MLLAVLKELNDVEFKSDMWAGLPVVVPVMFCGLMLRPWLFSRETVCGALLEKLVALVVGERAGGVLLLWRVVFGLVPLDSP